MSLAAPIEYTDAAQMLADYAARRRMLFAKSTLVVLPAPLEPEPELALKEDAEVAEAVEEAPAKLSARQILRETCERHQVKLEWVVGERRYKQLVICRREAAWQIAKQTSLSLPQIAALLKKDHTTVLMAIRRHNETTGENVRGCGGIPDKTRERNRLSARKIKAKTRAMRLRIAEMKIDREEFRL